MDVAQFIWCLPSMQEVMGSAPSTIHNHIHIIHGGTYLKAQNLGGGGKRIRSQVILSYTESLKIAWATLRPYLKQTKQQVEAFDN